MTTTPTEAKPSAASRRTNRNSSPPPRIVIQYPTPAVDGGRYAAKRCVGDTVEVEADIFRDGHDLLRAVVRYRARATPTTASRRWSGSTRTSAASAGPGASTSTARDAGSTPSRPGPTRSGPGATSSSARSSRSSTTSPARSRRASCSSKPRRRSPGTMRTSALVGHAATALADDNIPESAKHDVALGPELFATVERIQPRHGSVSLPEPIAVEVDRLRARFGSWYELFPRSWGGLIGVKAQLPRLAELGFDVLYLPPIHPIGQTNRKGANNTLIAGPNDPGSPWAIGDETGGHEAVHRELGTIEDFDRPLASRHEAPASRSRSTSRSSARPTTPGSTSIRSGSTAAPTARSSTPRTRPSATRTSTTSTGTPRTGRPSGTRSSRWSSTGSTPASRCSGSTTRTPSRSSSGTG